MDLVQIEEKKVGDTEVGAITRRIALESFEARTRESGRTIYREKHGCASTSALSCEAASRARQADVQRRVVCWWKQIGQLGATRPRQAEWRPVGCMLLLLAYCSSISNHRYQPNHALSLSVKSCAVADPNRRKPFLCSSDEIRLYVSTILPDIKP